MVHPEPSWLPWQTGNAGWPRGARRPSRPPQALQVTTEARALHVDEGQLVMLEGGSRWSWGAWWSRWSPRPHAWLTLLPLQTRLPRRPGEPLGPHITWFAVLAGISRLSIPAGGSILPWWPWGTSDLLHHQAVSVLGQGPRGTRVPWFPFLALGARVAKASAALNTQLSFLPLRDSNKEMQVSNADTSPAPSILQHLTHLFALDTAQPHDTAGSHIPFQAEFVLLPLVTSGASASPGDLQHSLCSGPLG